MYRGRKRLRGNSGKTSRELTIYVRTRNVSLVRKKGSRRALQRVCVYTKHDCSFAFAFLHSALEIVNVLTFRGFWTRLVI